MLLVHPSNFCASNPPIDLHLHITLTKRNGATEYVQEKQMAHEALLHMDSSEEAQMF